MSAAITGTKVYSSPLAAKRLLILTAPISSADDAITLNLADHGVRNLYGCIGQVTAGMDANFLAIQVSHSALVITIVSKKESGAAADAWGDTTVELWCLVD